MDGDATTQILSCLSPSIRDIVMLSLTMEASSLGQPSVLFSQSFDSDDYDDDHDDDDDRQIDDTNLNYENDGTNVDTNSNGNGGGIDTRSFSLALVPVQQQQQQTMPSSASSIFKAKIPSPSLKFKRSSTGEIDVNVVNTVDLTSIPLVQAPKLDDDENDNDNEVRANDVMGSGNIDQHESTNGNRLDKSLDKERKKSSDTFDNDVDEKEFQVSSSPIENLLEVLPEQKFSSLFAERYFNVVKEVHKEYIIP